MASVLKIKRSSVQGKSPTTSNLETGELALNLRDQKLFSSDGSAVFEVGANVAISHIGSLTVGNTNPYELPATDGASGYVLATNGSGTVSFTDPTSVSGLKGEKGEKGQKGTTGDTGAAGADGSDGSKGQKGEVGATGAAGDTGAQGDKGQKGEAGTNGTNGTDGADGADGAKGQKGEIGATGSAGADGADGAAGAKGQKGEAGTNGTNGTNGADGSKGQKGEVGATGAAGADGADGSKGQKGEVGANGSDGTNGDPGAKGQKGEAGTNGSDGSDGAKGQKGEAGTNGSDGAKGQKGEVGATGATGADGNFGGAAFEFNFGGWSQTDTDPGAGDLAFNNTKAVYTTELYIDDTDLNGNDIQSFLRTIDDSTSTIKGHVKVSERLSSDNFAIFTISSVTENTGYFTVDVTHLQTGGSFDSSTTSTDVVATFARTGDVGDKGQKGEVGTTGDKGQKGEAGTNGTNGSDGAKGQKGEAGTNGTNGADGSKGQKGEAGTNGTNGSDGAKGQKGQKGEAGTNGTNGSDGAKGQKGEKGEWGGTATGNVNLNSYNITAVANVQFTAHSSDAFSIYTKVTDTNLTTAYLDISDDTNTDAIVFRHTSYTGSGVSPLNLDMMKLKRHTAGHADIAVQGDVYPTSDAAYDLGKSGAEWGVLYANTVVATGQISAATKSFDIPHPTQENMRLRYGSLEGPENGVYVRGVVSNNTIVLPEHWTGLVDAETITVHITPIGESQDVSVAKVSNNKVYLNGVKECYFSVFGERKDVSKLVIEYEG